MKAIIAVYAADLIALPADAIEGACDEYRLEHGRWPGSGELAKRAREIADAQAAARRIEGPTEATLARRRDLAARQSQAMCPPATWEWLQGQPEAERARMLARLAERFADWVSYACPDDVLLQQPDSTAAARRWVAGAIAEIAGRTEEACHEERMARSEESRRAFRDAHPDRFMSAQPRHNLDRWRSVSDAASEGGADTPQRDRRPEPGRMSGRARSMVRDALRASPTDRSNSIARDAWVSVVSERSPEDDGGL